MKTVSKIFWGLFFLMSAAFVIINQLGYYTNLELLPLLLTIFIGAILIKSLYRINFFGILFSLAFLAIIYSNQLGLQSITPWPVLITAFLASIGLSIIFNRSHCQIKHNHHEHFDQVINDKDSDVVNFEVSFGSSIKYVNSDDFKSASLRCSFGALKVYFDNAKIVGDTATINLDASFSGIEIYIPKDWKIVNNVDSSLGAVEEKNNSNSVSTKTVTITGHVSLAGVEITYI